MPVLIPPSLLLSESLIFTQPWKKWRLHIWRRTQRKIHPPLLPPSLSLCLWPRPHSLTDRPTVGRTKPNYEALVEVNSSGVFAAAAAGGRSFPSQLCSGHRVCEFMRALITFFCISSATFLSKLHRSALFWPPLHPPLPLYLPGGSRSGRWDSCLSRLSFLHFLVFIIFHFRWGR